MAPCQHQLLVKGTCASTLVHQLLRIHSLSVNIHTHFSITQLVTVSKNSCLAWHIETWKQSAKVVTPLDTMGNSELIWFVIL